jgi:hypothetical protein
MKIKTTRMGHAAGWLINVIFRVVAIYWLWNNLLTDFVPVRDIGIFEAVGLRVLMLSFLPFHYATVDYELVD